MRGTSTFYLYTHQPSWPFGNPTSVVAWRRLYARSDYVTRHGSKTGHRYLKIRRIAVKHLNQTVCEFLGDVCTHIHPLLWKNKNDPYITSTTDAAVTHVLTHKPVSTYSICLSVNKDALNKLLTAHQPRSVMADPSALIIGERRPLRRCSLSAPYRPGPSYLRQVRADSHADQPVGGTCGNSRNQPSSFGDRARRQNWSTSHI